MLALLTVFSYAQATQPQAKKAPVNKAAATAAPKVYICEGGSAYAYYSSSSCAGLNRCTHTVSAVTRANAEGTHSRVPCKKCY